jgi:HK97 family phage prohead protease
MNRQPRLVGYAVVFGAIGQSSRKEGRLRIAPGAFASSIRSNGEILALFKHDWWLELASNQEIGSSLSLKEDSRGLAFEIQPYEDRKWIDSAISEIREGKVCSMSAGFRILEFRKDLDILTILKAELLEISPVCFPDFLGTSIRLLEPAEPARAAGNRDVIRIDPALVSNPRRRNIHAGMTINC